MQTLCLTAVLTVLAPVVALAADEMVPFVIPAVPNDRSLAAVAPAPAIAPGDKRVAARDGHFWRDGRRVRVWGVNLCFGANFPAHADAEHAAARLAQAGINSVRLHHMDMQAYPGGIWDRTDPAKLSTEALERLDYFVDQLARRGILVNANLHVSRTHSKFLGLPREGDMPDFDKIIGIFTPRLVDAQKQYARDLLTHVNPYRKVRYADDPAIAFVEITNEDSFFMWDGDYRLRNLAGYYEKILREMYVRWLAKRHGSTDALRKAWNAGAQPLGDSILGDAAMTLQQPADKTAAHWELEQHAGAKASAKPLADVPNAARVEIASISAIDWHIQFKNVGLKLRGGQYYTLTFRARADKPRKIGVAVGMSHEPWGNLGLSRSVDLTDRWRPVRMGFVATADDTNARVSFTLGAVATAVELADVAMGAGGQVGLAPGETIEAGNVALFADSEVEARALDRIRFLAQTEKDYFDAMRTFVRDELGCKALVTGTIVFGPAGMYAQSDMDFVDAHSYWHHPHFPGRSWDPGNWIVEQSAMTDQASGGTLPELAASRLAGKPYTVSEYNHPAPMDAQAECVPMIAAFAASQDWDGIWLFAYCHRGNDWDPRRFTSFFDMDANPAKFGFCGPGATIFRDAGIAPVAEQKLCNVPGAGPDALSAFADLKLRRGDSMWRVARGEGKVAWPEVLAARLYASAGGKLAQPERTGPPIQWTVANGRGHFLAAGPSALVETGWSDGAGKDTPVFRAVTVTALDGKPLAESRRIFLAACGRSENTDMKFSADRRTVGRNWGKAPVRVEPVDHTVKLPGRAGEKLRLQPLGPDGLPAGEAVEITLDADKTVRLAARYATMWYLLTRP